MTECANGSLAMFAREPSKMDGSAAVAGDEFVVIAVCDAIGVLSSS
jgi:hypothetical protein